MELGEFAELKRGYDLPKREREIGIIPLVSSSGTTDLHSVAKVKGPGVITGRYGTIGQVFYVEEDFWPLNTTLYVQNFKNNNPLFVYYLLKTISYEDYSDKAAVPGINRNHLHKAKVRVPVNPSHQQEIAEKLWVLDSKIELNRQINQTLEQIAQAIFKSWFVDFEPTHAKIIAKAQSADPATQELAAQAIICGAITLEQLQGYAEESVEESAQQREQESLSTRLQKAINEKLSQASANPLNATTAEQLIATAALFPNALVESELGEVPEGWETSCLGNVTTELRRGISPKYTEEDGVLVVNQRCIRNHSIDFKLARLNDPKKRKIEGREIKVGDILVNSTGVGTLGRLAPVRYLHQTTVFDSHVTIVRADTSKITKAFLCGMMFEKEKFIESSGAGSTGQTELRRQVLEDINFSKPPIQLGLIYETYTESITKVIAELEVQQQTLSELRDALLPKLLSGEIDVSALADNTEVNA